MVIINLLPWREAVFAYEQRMLRIILLAVLIASVALVGVLTFYVMKQESRLNLQVNALKQALYTLSDQKKSRQIQTVNSASHYQESALYHTGMKTQALLRAVISSPAQGLCLTQISRKQGFITFVGRARSAVDLSDFLQHWNAAYLFSAIIIEQLKQQTDNSFIFRFRGQEVINDLL